MLLCGLSHSADFTCHHLWISASSQSTTRLLILTPAGKSPRRIMSSNVDFGSPTRFITSRRRRSLFTFRNVASRKLDAVFGLDTKNRPFQHQLKEIFGIARRRSCPTVLSVQAKNKSRKEGCVCCVYRQKKSPPTGWTDSNQTPSNPRR